MAEAKDATLLSPTRSLNSAHRRPQPPPQVPSLPLYSKLGRKSEDQPDLSFQALVDRHRYLLVTVVILVILCSIYLYFAVSMDAKVEAGYSGVACKGLSGEALKECQEKLLSKASQSS